MTGYYLATITVPIPEDKLVVIRDREKVEYEVDRIYIGNRSTRVKRKVIGKVDPVQPGRMFPNEKIEPFKRERINEVLEELRGCIDDERIKPFLRLIEEGLSYSDVMILMKWYKVLPR